MFCARVLIKKADARDRTREFGLFPAPQINVTRWNIPKIFEKSKHHSVTFAVFCVQLWLDEGPAAAAAAAAAVVVVVVGRLLLGLHHHGKQELCRRKIERFVREGGAEETEEAAKEEEGEGAKGK